MSGSFKQLTLIHNNCADVAP